jgi:ATP-dependent Clp protease ATP-binding subunit ClpA
MSRLGFTAAEHEETEIKDKDYKKRIKGALKESFRPEFLNRIDEIVIFNSLDKKVLNKIVDIQLAELTEQLDVRGIKLSVDAKAKKYIIDNGFDPEFGARPMKRLIQKVILDKLADHIIKGEVKDGSKVKISLEKSDIKVSV